MDPISNYVERESTYTLIKAQEIRDRSYDFHAYSGQFPRYLLQRMQLDNMIPLLFPLLNGNIDLVFDQVFENRQPFLTLSQQLTNIRTRPLIILTGSRRRQFSRALPENRTLKKRMKVDLNAEQIQKIKNDTIDFTELVTQETYFANNPIIVDDNKTELQLWLFPEQNLIFGTFMVDNYIDNSNFDNAQTATFHRLILRILAICQSLFSKTAYIEGLENNFIDDFAENYYNYFFNNKGEEIRETWSQYRDLLQIQNSTSFLESQYNEFQYRLLKVKRDKIEKLTSDYESLLFNMDSLLQSIREAETRLLEVDSPEQKFDFISAVNNENIRRIRFSGLEMIMDIETPARLNEDDVRNYLIGLPKRSFNDKTKEALSMLFEGYLDKRFKFYFIATIKSNMNTEAQRRDLSVSGSASGLSPKMRGTPNPHLKYAGCLGSNGPELIYALSKRNWIGFINQAIYTVGQLNVVDSGIMNRFIEDQLMSGDVYLHLKDGRIIQALEYLKIKGETDEDQTPEAD